MLRLTSLLLFLVAYISGAYAQTSGKPKMKQAANDTIRYAFNTPTFSGSDSSPTVNLKDVNIVSFKNPADWDTYYKYKSRIQKVMPYVKIAKQLYVELQEEKSNSKKRVYRHYRKDLEKEMRAKFEKELKNLSVGQGEMLFKLLNRETGNNAYNIIKDVKGSPTAWFYQLVGKRWGYDLKEKYDPKEEKIIELIIRELGPAYNI